MHHGTHGKPGGCGYRLTQGVADRSFGLNVARMAQLPSVVIDFAGQKAAAFEAATMQHLRCSPDCSDSPHEQVHLMDHTCASWNHCMSTAFAGTQMSLEMRMGAATSK